MKPPAERNPDAAREKAAVRAAMRRRRRTITAADAKAAGEAAAGWLLASPCWDAVRSVLGYAAVRGEIAVDAILQAAALAGKAVCLPRPDANGHVLDPRRWLPSDPLEVGMFGIPVPLMRSAPCEDTSRALVLVPGLAFDARGARVGTGGGYYDRYLADRRPAWVVGVAYDWQRVPHLPREPHDVCVDAVLTPSGLYWAEGQTEAMCAARLHGRDGGAALCRGAQGDALPAASEDGIRRPDQA